MKAKITKPVLAAMQEAFYLDLDSPSGLRWKRWNGARGTFSRDAGEVAGSKTNAGVYVIGFNGEKYLAAEAMAALHRAAHREARS
ncbi:hypothetical protein FHW75_004651 [Pseudomonas sp. OG7]|uniref:hypothetical protein n=1 Tax=Pseudomonas sp. OG7 TaxID=2587037 RepID=UPI0016174230|nr:hypothetical protein [Pseudomonas sp. OG7]MBB3273440.1 hypothetical protein [Pseudomonas sp. OG7]